ncbi:MAG: hypothetical protein IKV57_00010 [Clostridia bacterium]|nr:hypothetical protein [Clostridia bacterium]
MTLHSLSYGHIPTTGERCERPGFGHRRGTGKEPDTLSFDGFMRLLERHVEFDKFTAFVDGKIVRLNPKWLRDYIFELKAFKHWEFTLKDYLTFIAEHQTETGFFYEMLQRETDGHIRSEICGSDRDSELLKFFPGGLALGRIEMEADIEFLMVEGVWQVYQATGDTEWLRWMLSRLEKGIDYCTSHEKRWEPSLGLVKREFSVDMFDFTHGKYFGKPRLIYEDSPMSVFYGDNTGVYAAMRILARMRRIFGEEEKAVSWEDRAETLRQSIVRYLWNGKIFTHNLHLNHDGLGMDEREMLSLSECYSINRGAATHEQACSILEEYIRRRENGGKFAEWFTLDPPYPMFGSYEGGTYINGSISSVAAGQLALAAFRHGYEAYGWDILCRLQNLAQKDGKIFFMYDPADGADVNGGPVGWGAAEILGAIEEGLAGLEDRGVRYDVLGFSPRWVVTGRTEMEYYTGYEISGTLVQYGYRLSQDRMEFVLRAPCRRVEGHVLLPEGTVCTGLLVNDVPAAYTEAMVRQSRYADFILDAVPDTEQQITLLLHNI